VIALADTPEMQSPRKLVNAFDKLRGGVSQPFLIDFLGKRAGLGAMFKLEFQQIK
jgi:hypothetical protein